MDEMKMLRWLARQNRDLQLIVFNHAYPDSHGRAERAKLILACRQIYEQMHRDRRKEVDRDDDLAKMAQVTKIRLTALRKQKGGRRKSKLKRKVALRMKLIDQLHDEGLGWRLIARYLKKYADLKISHTHLQRLYFQIKEENF